MRKRQEQHMTVCLSPAGLCVLASGVDLNWIMLNGFIVTLPCFPPVVLAIFWAKTSRAGVIAGTQPPLVLHMVIPVFYILKSTH